MPTSSKSRDAFRRMNQRTFEKNARRKTNLARNTAALKAMSLAERLTGKTADELVEEQRQLKADFYRRQGLTA